MCTKMLSGRGMRLSATTTNEVFTPLTEWMAYPAVDAWSFDVLHRALRGSENLVVRPGVQVAAVRTDDPNAPVALGTAMNTPGWTRFTPTIEINLAYMFVRFGVFSASDAAGFSEADVALDVALDLRGEVLGRTRIELQPFNDNTNVAMYPLGSWVPSVDAVSVKAAIVVANNLNSIRTQLYVRYADDRAAPAATWVALEGGFVDMAAGNQSRNSGYRALSPDGHWMQLALGVRRDTVVSRATIDVVAALRTN